MIKYSMIVLRTYLLNGSCEVWDPEADEDLFFKIRLQFFFGFFQTADGSSCSSDKLVGKKTLRSISGGSAVCCLRTASSLTAVTEGSYSNKDVGQTLSPSLSLFARARVCVCVWQAWKVCHHMSFLPPTMTALVSCFLRRRRLPVRS